MRKVKYHSIKRPTKADPIGLTAVSLALLSNAGEVESSIPLGTLQRTGGKGNFSFMATAQDDTEHGPFTTHAQAGEALRIYNDKMLAGEIQPAEAEKLLSLEDAAKELCTEAAKPVDALKRRIKRGSIATKEIDGVTMVVMPAE